MAPSSSILLVDDDPGAIQAMNRLLAGFGTTRFATSGYDALHIAREAEPHLILLDAEMPGMTGFQVCEELKADRALKDIPVIFVTSHDDQDFQLASFKLGATDYITKPVNPELALARITTHLRNKHHSDEVRQHLRIDPLTDVLNERGFKEALRREWRRALRSGEPISLLNVEIDRLDLVMEHGGESAGEQCLKSIAKCLSRVCKRPADVVARTSETSFAILLPLTPRTGAEHMAHRILDSVENLRLPNPRFDVSNHVTVSVGIGCYDNDSVNWIDPLPDSRFVDALRTHTRADDLEVTAQLSLRAAKLGGRAQAWLLDIADLDMPRLAREISPGLRQTQQRRSHTATESVGG